MVLNVSMCHQSAVCPDCVRSNQRGCKFKIFLGGGGGMPPDFPNRYARTSHATIILVPSCSPPPQTQNPV